MARKRSRTPWKRRRKWHNPQPKATRQGKLPRQAKLPGQAAPAASTNLDPETLARLAEGVWRLKRRLEGEASRDWADLIVSGLSHDLQALGVEIVDRTGTRFSAGETTQVVHNEAPSGWDGHLTVTDVVRPTIRVSGVVVQPGQVVVGPEHD